MALTHKYPWTTGTIVSRGQSWIIGWFDPVLFVLFFNETTPSDFSAYVQATANEIDACPITTRRAVLYHAPVGGAADSSQRQAVGDVLAKRREKVGKICSGFVFCSTSMLTRSAVSVINWLAPPPYPTFEAPTVEEGLQKLQRTEPGIVPSSYLRSYQSMFASHLAQVKSKGVSR